MAEVQTRQGPIDLQSTTAVGAPGVPTPGAAKKSDVVAQILKGRNLEADSKSAAAVDVQHKVEQLQTHAPDPSYSNEVAKLAARANKGGETAPIPLPSIATPAAQKANASTPPPEPPVDTKKPGYSWLWGVAMIVVGCAVTIFGRYSQNNRISAAGLALMSAGGCVVYKLYPYNATPAVAGGSKQASAASTV